MGLLATFSSGVKAKLVLILTLNNEYYYLIVCQTLTSAPTITAFVNPVGLFAKTELVGIAVFASKDLFWTLTGELVQVIIIRYLAMEIILTVDKATLSRIYSCKDSL